MKSKLYKSFIDYLVEVCRNGQGQIGPERARRGIWNVNATEDFLEDQHEVNILLSQLDEKQREILANLLEEKFIGGVFESIKALEVFKIEPFVEGYEGSPYYDFIGRVDKDQWEWPDE
jgi:hypothetical protein